MEGTPLRLSHSFSSFFKVTIAMKVALEWTLLSTFFKTERFLSVSLSSLKMTESKHESSAAILSSSDDEEGLATCPSKELLSPFNMRALLRWRRLRNSGPTLEVRKGSSREL